MSGKSWHCKAAQPQPTICHCSRQPPLDDSQEAAIFGSKVSVVGSKHLNLNSEPGWWLNLMRGVFRGRQSARGKAECQAVSFHPEDDSLETVVNLEKSDILQQLQAESPLCQVFFILFLAPGFFFNF